MPVIAHCSDPHLDRSRTRLDRLSAVLDEIASLPSVDALVITGDLADHGAQDEYDELLRALPSDLPVLLTPGNHDRTEPMLDALVGHGHPRGLDTVLDVEGVRIVGLDSHLDGRDEGALSADSLTFADKQAGGTNGPVLLAMHHPAVPVGHDVADATGLTNREALATVIRRHSNIVGILTGHVHTALAASFAGVPLVGAPGIASTMRLGNRTDPIADVHASPGLAVHTVDAEGVRTVFHTLVPDR